MDSTDWSEELKALTRETLTALPIPLGSEVALKHRDGGFATIGITDLVHQKYTVTDRTDGQMHSYPSLESLIEGGWVID
ncbi:hypothetical protein [Cupriavidus sp. D39]|uniref:hypothetical protein n=1 Tax=Cupriavidus sp. D39 TaxID=2997877 RepID=UPI00226F51A8|nr:hypothetical protein [Cupriavidus sp. D39]MCY0854037.1 hypothetical protein [Cupriavidus sp. D39]